MMFTPRPITRDDLKIMNEMQPNIAKGLVNFYWRGDITLEDLEFTLSPLQIIHLNDKVRTWLYRLREWGALPLHGQQSVMRGAIWTARQEIERGKL